TTRPYPMTARPDLQRRTLLSSAVATAAVLGSAHAADTQPTQEKTTMPALPAFESQSALKPLAFDPAKLKGLSERLIRSHWENNYGGSVKALAVVKKQLAEALENKDTPPYVYNDLKREHLMRTGSVVLHDLYFDNLGGNGKADAAARSALSDAFGAYDTWESEFRRIGLGLGGDRKRVG